jgi:hypothetical protein
MPRGSKPGERRGGRRPGSKNRRTLQLEAAVRQTVEGAKASDELPAEFLRRVVQNEALDLNVRIAAAQACAPYFSPKLGNLRLEHENKPRAIYYMREERLTIEQWEQKYCVEPGTPFISDCPFADDDDVRQSQDAIHRLEVDALRRENEELKAEIAKLRTEAAMRNDPGVALKKIPDLS